MSNTLFKSLSQAEQYVNTINQKLSCKVATTENITLSGEKNGDGIDGVSIVAGDRVLVKDQGGGVSHSDNGIYVCSTGQWSRSTDMNSNETCRPNSFVFIEQGSTNADKMFQLTNDSIVLGTTSLTFAEYGGGSGSGIEGVIAGTGLTDGGTSGTVTLNVVGGTGITANANDISIDSTVATLSDSQELTNKTLTSATLNSAVLNTGVSGTAILDEDDMNSNSATQLATQQSIKAYVDSQVTAQDLDFQGDTGGAQSIDLDSQTLTLEGGTGIDTTGGTNKVSFAIDSTVATKSYVDGVAQGLDLKEACRIATTTSGTLSSDFENGDTIDGIELSTGDRILIKDQSTASENGIYIINSSGSPTRSSDMANDTGASGIFTFITEGTANGDNGFVCTSDSGSDVVGTNDLVFTQFSGAGQITAGDGLIKIGNKLDVDLKSNGGLVFESNKLALNLGESHITGTLAIGDGGTGASTLDDLITLGNHTTGNYVASLVAGNLIDLQNNTGENSTPTIDVDLSEANEASIAHGDYILFLDGGSTGTAAKESLSDLVGLLAGTGLTTTNSVLKIATTQNTITSIKNTGLEIGRDDDNTINFGTDNTIIFNASGSERVSITNSGINITGDITVSGSYNLASGDIPNNAADTSGTAAIATSITASANNSTDETVYLTFVDGATGTQGIETDTGLTYNPSSGILTTTTVNGDLIGNVTGNVTGNVSGSSGSCTGNAATATILETERTIGGVSFNGSSNINLPGVNTTGNQDTSGTAAIATSITASANNSTDETVYLTFVDGATGTQGIETDTGLTYNPSSGILTTTTVNGDLIGDVTGNVTGNVSGSSGSCTGNASTATALETARTIHGVSFDGTSNIDLSEVIQDTVGAMFSSNTETDITASYQDIDGTIDLVVGTLNQDTTGNAATATVATSITASANNSTDETVYLTFVDGATGTQGIETDTGLTYNPSSGILTTTSVTGNLNGTVLTATQNTIDHDSLANRVENEHIDHSSVSITAGDGLTGGGTIAATRTLNVGAGTGINVGSDSISVDVSDFMENGSDNRIVTAKGTDGMNAESNLTFDGSILNVNGSLTISGNIVPNADITYDLGSDSYRFRDIYLSGSTIYLGGYSLSVSNSGTNELVIKDDNNEHVHIHSHIKNKSKSKIIGSQGYINVTTSWMHVDSDIILTYTAPETGTYLVECGYGIAWFWNPNWFYTGLSNTTSNTPSLILGTRQQIMYTGGGSYHREQVNTTFVVDLTKDTTYNFRLAVRKYFNYTLRIYRGNGSSEGGPHGYIDIRGPISKYVSV